MCEIYKPIHELPWLAFSPTNAQPRPQGFSLKKMGKALGKKLTNALRF